MVSFLDFQGEALEFCRHAQRGGDDADFALAAREADGDAGATTEQEQLAVLFDDGQQVRDVFSLCDDHERLSCVSMNR